MKHIIPVAALVLYSAFAFSQSSDSCVSGDCKNGIGEIHIKVEDPRSGITRYVYKGHFKDGKLDGEGTLFTYDYPRQTTYKGVFKNGNATGIGQLDTRKYAGQFGDEFVMNDNGLITEFFDYEDAKNYDEVAVFNDGSLLPHYYRNGKMNDKLSRKNSNEAINKLATDFLANYKGKIHLPTQWIVKKKTVAVAQDKWVECIKYQLVKDERAYNIWHTDGYVGGQIPFGAQHTLQILNDKGDVVFEGSEIYNYQPPATGTYTILIMYTQKYGGKQTNDHFYVPAYNIYFSLYAEWPK